MGPISVLNNVIFVWLFWFWVAETNKWPPPTLLSIPTPSPRFMTCGFDLSDHWMKTSPDMFPLFRYPSAAQSWAVMGGATHACLAASQADSWADPWQLKLRWHSGFAQVCAMSRYSFGSPSPYLFALTFILPSLDIKGNDINLTAEH